MAQTSRSSPAIGGAVPTHSLVAQRGLDGTTGGGRKALGDEASRKINTIRQKCPEDFESLAKRLEAWSKRAITRSTWHNELLH